MNLRTKSANSKTMLELMFFVAKGCYTIVGDSVFAKVTVPCSPHKMERQNESRWKYRCTQHTAVGPRPQRWVVCPGGLPTNNIY